MKLLATRKPEQNTAAVDPWTAVHFSAGLAMGLINLPLRTAVVASLAYELLEQYFERRGWGNEIFETSGPESFPNVVIDVAVMVAGHRLGRRWNETR